MKAIKKCPPPKSPYHKRDFNVCTEPNDFDPLFMENVKDIAETMAEIMIVCGIHRCKATKSCMIVINAFQFYDMKRHRFETADNECGICRTVFVHDLEEMCSMTHVEALLAYCIVKRAIKAFFHGTPDHSIRSPVTEAVVLKQQEFAWLHAARRTIMIFERYEQMFFESQINYATQILNIYTELHDRLKNRADPVILEEYHPRGCVKKIVIGTRSPPKLEREKQICVSKCKESHDWRKETPNEPPYKLPIQNCFTLPSSCPLTSRYEGKIVEPREDSPPAKRKKELKTPDLILPRCFQCNWPQIICDCDTDRDTGVVVIDCSQGPFGCQWMEMDKRDKFDRCTDKPEFHQCPVDCVTSESSNESDNSEYCECSAESNKDDDDDSVGDVIKLRQDDEQTEYSEDNQTQEKLMPTKLQNNKNAKFCHK